MTQEEKFYKWVSNNPKASQELKNIISQVNMISPKFKKERNKKWRNEKIKFETKWIDIFLNKTHETI